MPMPSEYQRATDHLLAFLVDARDEAELGSIHQSYTMTQGVFYTFRARLELKEAIRFAGVLPAVLRAIFVANWDTDAPVVPFGDRDSMTAEVKAFRADHNFSPISAIRDVARALRRHVNEEEFDNVLQAFPLGAVDFWDPNP
jgi:uncharacterized protein (DUF2267 family)